MKPVIQTTAYLITYLPAYVIYIHTYLLTYILDRARVGSDPVRLQSMACTSSGLSVVSCTAAGGTHVDLFDLSGAVNVMTRLQKAPVGARKLSGWTVD